MNTAYSAACRLSMRPAFFALLLCCCSPIAAQVRPAVAVWGPEPGTVLVGSQSGLQTYSWPALQLLKTLDCPMETVLSLSLSASRQQLLVAGGTAGETGQLQILDLPSGRSTQLASPHSDRITRVQWLPQEQLLLTASDDGTAAVLNAADGTPVQRITLHSKPLLALACYQQTAVTAGMDGIIRLWHTQNGQLLRTLDNHTAPITTLLIPHAAANTDSPPSMYSASRDRTVRLWQPDRGRLVRFARLNSVPECLTLTSDGSLLLAGCSDGSLLTLQPTTLQVLQTQQSDAGTICEILPAPDSDDLLICGSNGLRRMTARTGEQ